MCTEAAKCGSFLLLFCTLCPRLIIKTSGNTELENGNGLLLLLILKYAVWREHACQHANVTAGNKQAMDTLKWALKFKAREPEVSLPDVEPLLISIFGMLGKLL